MILMLWYRCHVPGCDWMDSFREKAPPAIEEEFIDNRFADTWPVGPVAEWIHSYSAEMPERGRGPLR